MFREFGKLRVLDFKECGPAMSRTTILSMARTGEDAQRLSLLLDEEKLKALDEKSETYTYRRVAAVAGEESGKAN